MKNPAPHCQNPRQAAQACPSRRSEGEPNWRARLPSTYAEAIIPPLYFKRYSEYEIRAARTVGYDADDQPCHIAHQVELTRLLSDDDEEFYEVIAYQEELAAWRLRDDRWLVFRATASEQCTASRGFYAISPDMPR